MAQLNIHLKGWQIVVALFVLAGLAGFRLISFQDKTGDANLMRDLERQIISDYFPGETERLRAAVDSGYNSKITEVTESITHAKPKIESVRISSPLFSMSTSENVVVRIVYSLAEGTKTRDRKTLYFLYKHGAIGNTWSYQHKTTAIRFYMNFI